MLQEFATDVYVVDGPTVSFLSFPYPTRMAIVKLSDGGLWVWSPVELSDALEADVRALGPVRHIVSPNKIHHLFLKAWAQRWPEAKLYAPPGLPERKLDSISGLEFDEVLTEDAPAAWAPDIDQALFSGSLVMQEVAFFHRPSKTALFCDLIQRHEEERCTGIKGWVMRADALVGQKGSTPREWRWTFQRRDKARAARDRVIEWNAQRLVIAHGMCAQDGATPIIKEALKWI